MGRILETIAKFWQYQENDLLNPDIIIPLGYGLMTQNELPIDEELILKKTMEIKKEFPRAKIAFASANNFWKNCKTQEDIIKINFLWQLGLENLNDVVKTEKGILNSVDEAKKIKNALDILEIEPKEIVVIAERLHSRSAYKIYKYFFPKTKIVIRNIKGILNSKNPEIHRKSELRWLLANLIRHILFCIFKEKIIKMRSKINFKN